MKVYISADMEGATGIAVKAQVVEGHPGYERARRLLTGDVNAAVAGAFAGVAGGLYATFLSFIDPSSFDLDASILLLTMVVVGGARTLA